MKKTVLPSGVNAGDASFCGPEIVPGAKTCGWGGAAIAALHASNSAATVRTDKVEFRVTRKPRLPWKRNHVR